MSKANDEMVMNIIRQVIKEVKQEMKSGNKILTESKTPQKVFKNQETRMKEYIAENVMAALDNAGK